MFPPPVAVNARMARGPDLLQKCPECHWRPTPGERVAERVSDGALVHVACAAKAAGR